MLESTSATSRRGSRRSLIPIRHRPRQWSQTAGASNLDSKAGFAAGTYEFVVRADGYGHVRFRETFSGGSKTVTIKMPTNYASMSKGSVASGDGTNHQHLIDDREGTNWDRAPNGSR